MRLRVSDPEAFAEIAFFLQALLSFLGGWLPGGRHTQRTVAAAPMARAQRLNKPAIRRNASRKVRLSLTFPLNFRRLQSRPPDERSKGRIVRGRMPRVASRECRALGSKRIWIPFGDHPLKLER